MNVPSRLLSVVLAAVAIAACAQIVGFEDLDLTLDDGGNDPLPARDAPSGTEAAAEASIDAPADANAGPPGFCERARDAGIDGGGEILFCDDFERTTPVGFGWNLAVTYMHESLEVSTAQASSGTRSLFAAVPIGESALGRSAYLQADLDAGAFPVFLEFDLYVEKTQEYGPGSEYSGFLFALYASGTALFPIASGAVGDAGWNPYLPENAGPVVVLSLREWHHVSYRIDAAGLRATFAPDGGATTTRTRPVTVERPPNLFWVGANVGSGGGPTKLYIDNVVVHR